MTTRLMDWFPDCLFTFNAQSTAATAGSTSTRRKPPTWYKGGQTTPAAIYQLIKETILAKEKILLMDCVGWGQLGDRKTEKNTCFYQSQPHNSVPEAMVLILLPARMGDPHALKRWGQWSSATDLTCYGGGGTARSSASRGIQPHKNCQRLPRWWRQRPILSHWWCHPPCRQGWCHQLQRDLLSVTGDLTLMVMRWSHPHGYEDNTISCKGINPLTGDLTHSHSPWWQKHNTFICEGADSQWLAISPIMW